MPAPLKVNVLTLFPEYFERAFAFSILKRAREKGLFAPGIVNIRDFTTDRHHTADDTPFGGGDGMVMKIEPIDRALAALRKKRTLGKVYLLSPAGVPFDQAMAKRLAKQKAFTLICGRYEGVDERVAEHLCDGEISIGDYVLSGGEFAAAVITDAVVRLLPGVLGAEGSAAQDSFMDGLLDFPHYTRPRQYRRWPVPEVLLSGDHARISAWRREQQWFRTSRRRPDLVERITASAVSPKARSKQGQESKPLPARRRK